MLGMSGRKVGLVLPSPCDARTSTAMNLGLMGHAAGVWKYMILCKVERDASCFETVSPGSHLEHSFTNAKAPITDRMCSLITPTI
jgi:hypothetical protein